MTSHGLRKLRLLLWSAVLVIGGAVTWALLSGPTAIDPARLGQGDYRLQATSGQEFTQASLIGQPSVVFFGFTHCPDICPATLAEIARWQDELGPLAPGLRVWMITVDPERDTLPVLRDYLTWLPEVTGATGPRDQIDRALAAFDITVRRVTISGSEYTVDHSAPILLFAPDGVFLQAYGIQDGDAALTRLRAMLAPQV